MNQLRNLAPVVLLSLVFALCPAMTCRQGKAGAYQTLKGVQIAVDSAMKTYGVAVVTGKVTLAKQAEIDGIHLKYRAAFRLAVELARSDLSQAPPEAVTQWADELILIISTLEES